LFLSFFPSFLLFISLSLPYHFKDNKILILSMKKDMSHGNGLLVLAMTPPQASAPVLAQHQPGCQTQHLTNSLLRIHEWKTIEEQFRLKSSIGQGECLYQIFHCK
jgi:hypothetical protein